MSEERELLKRVRDALRELKGTHYNLYWDIQSMLDQPEQEPINFDLERMKLAAESPVSDVTVEGLIDKVKSNRVFYQEGYAQAELDLKREPLSDEEIYTRCCAMDSSYTCIFIDGVEWAEHQHGIRSFDNE
jgi:hypothetical protein